MRLQRQSIPFELKAVAEDGGTFEGYAAVFGNIDRGGDIIIPGAFKDTIPQFLASGVIAWQHDWAEPIGKPLEAFEDEKGLWIKASLSDTQRGRDARTLMKDGVVKRMSIGYKTMDSEWLNADNIGQYAGDSAPNLRDLEAAFNYGRALKKIELYEVSPVSIPMNPEADITSVKGAVSALSLDEHTDTVVSIVEDLTARFKANAENRLKEGRPLSERNRQRIDGVLLKLQDCLTFADGKSDEQPALAAYARFLEIESQLTGALPR